MNSSETFTWIYCWNFHDIISQYMNVNWFGFPFISDVTNQIVKVNSMECKYVSFVYYLFLLDVFIVKYMQ